MQCRLWRRCLAECPSLYIYYIQKIKMFDRVTVDFSVHAETSLGDEIFICGNIEQLGCWDTGRALKLETSKQIYPQWKNRRNLFLPPKVSLEFKLFTKSCDSIIKWEQIPENRKFAPNGSALISFTFSKLEMVYEPIVIREEKSIRKNTFEIIHDLSDEVSESSSGNEREFWMERSQRQQMVTDSSSKEIIQEAKILFESWMSESGKPKFKGSNQSDRIANTVHFILKKDKYNVVRPFNFATEKLIQKSPPGVYQFSRKQLDNYVIKKDFDDDSLKIFHVQNEQFAQEALRSIQRAYQGYFVLYLNNIQNLRLQKFQDLVQMLVVGDIQVLIGCLLYFRSNRANSVTMLKQNSFVVKKDNDSIIFIFFSKLAPDLSTDNEINHDFLSSVQKNLLNHRNFSLPENYRLNLLVHNNVLREVRKQKFLLVLICDRIQDISQKTITSLIRIASCENITIHILTADEMADIYRRLPISEKDRIIVYNKNGQILRPENKEKVVNLFQQLRINVPKYQEIFSLLKTKAKFWIDNGVLQKRENNNYLNLQLTAPNNSLGQQIALFLIAEFNKSNNILKYPYKVERFNQRNTIVIDVRPILNSYEFYSKLITSVNLSSSHKNYLFAFDFTEERLKYLQKLQKACQDKDIAYEGFVMSTQARRKGLKENDFQQFLSSLLSQSYFSITQEQIDFEASRKVSSGRSKHSSECEKDLDRPAIL